MVQKTNTKYANGTKPNQMAEAIDIKTKYKSLSKSNITTVRRSYQIKIQELKPNIYVGPRIIDSHFRRVHKLDMFEWQIMNDVIEENYKHQKSLTT